MEQNLPESLTIMQFSEPPRCRLRTSNIAERVNEETHRVEINEDWTMAKSYVDMNA